MPLPRPSKIIAVGLNYKDHAAEAEVALPRNPVLFAKLPSCLIADGEDIRLPQGCQSADYEAELGVVIGRTARKVTRATALEHVLGYVAVNDVTDRKAQSDDGQWVHSKSYDTFGPVGPRVVPAVDVGDPQNLTIRTILNGHTVQDSHTSQMLFGVAELIAYISARITLEPGDLIATGTPPGVGAFQDPPVFLRPGDVVVVEIERIGRLTNRVTRDVARHVDEEASPATASMRRS